MSTITTSGLSCLAISTASRPSDASPHTSHPSCFWRREHRPRRTISWSSANKIRSFMADPSFHYSERSEQIQLSRQHSTCSLRASRERCKHPMLAYCLHRLQQIARRVRLHNVAARARVERFTHHLWRIVLSDEQNFQT